MTTWHTRDRNEKYEGLGFSMLYSICVDSSLWTQSEKQVIGNVFQLQLFFVKEAMIDKVV